MFRRNEGSEAAAALLQELIAGGWRVPVILYTNERSLLEYIPDGFFAYTGDSDALVQYVIDAMERVHFGIPMRVPRLRRYRSAEGYSRDPDYTRNDLRGS